MDHPKETSYFVSFGWTPECLPQDEQKVLWMSDEASSSKRRVSWHESRQNMKTTDAVYRLLFDTIVI